MVMKLCTVIELGDTWRKLKCKFCDSHCFHDNHLIKLTKQCLTENTKNKMVSFLLQHGNKPTSCFPLFKFWITVSAERFKKKPCRFNWEHSKGLILKQTCQVSLKYTKPKGLGDDLSITSFMGFSKFCF